MTTNNQHVDQIVRELLLKEYGIVPGKQPNRLLEYVRNLHLVANLTSDEKRVLERFLPGMLGYLPDGKRESEAATKLFSKGLLYFKDGKFFESDLLREISEQILLGEEWLNHDS